MDSKQNPKQPLVSVILIVFNGERYISQQIDSILAQTYANLELIVCDDHSTDQTLEIVRGYAQKDSRVRWVQNRRNLGQALTFQNNFQLCQGEFITPSDCDDYWLPRKIETQLAYMLARPEIQLCFSDSMIVNHDLSLMLGSFQKKLGNSFRRKKIPIEILLKRNLVSTPTVFFRRNLFRKIIPIHEGMINVYDTWMALVGSLDGPLGYINQCLVLYRQHENNTVGARTQYTNYYLKRLNDPGFLQQYFKAKSGLIAVHKRLLALGGSNSARSALKEKITNQSVLLAAMQSANYPEFVRRLIRAAWTILNTGQKYHLTQCLFLAFSWGAIRKLKLHNQTD